LSPLARAAAFGSCDEVCQLLEAGALADERGPHGLTPLMLAVHDPAKVDSLLAAGADPAAVSEWGFTPLLLAAMTADAQPSVERLLDRGVPVACRALNGVTPLFGAANVGELGSMRALLDAGAESTPGVLRNALVYAACCGDVTTGKALLELGAEIDAPAFQGYTALISAATAGYGEFVELLLWAGADLEIRDEEGLTALAWASKVDPGHSRIVAQLLRAGADVRSRSNDGRTPLDWALEYSNHDHVRILRAAADRDP
jgi:ankyrin repeat protein